jgi:hypothetical protein
MGVNMLSWRPPWSAAARRGRAVATPRADVGQYTALRMATRLRLLPAAMLMILMVPAAAEPGSLGAWTCAQWLDARHHHRSKPMETWLAGYLTSSNQWALALGWADAPLLISEVLNLLDQNCKSTPDAPVTDVLDVIQSEFLRANWRDGK